MRVGVLTTFYEMTTSYSLCSVVESQLAALVKYGYKPVLFVHDNFKEGGVPEGVEVRKIVPRFKLVDYVHQEPEKDLQEQTDKVYEALKEGLKDIDVVIEHDLIFQGWFMPYCMAIHKLAEETEIKWLHWIHSVPNIDSGAKWPHSLRHTLPRNSRLVYLNNVGLIRAAESYGAWPKDVRIVWNAVDPRLFWNLHPLTKSLIDKYGLLDADLIQTYPVSTPRMVDGKGLHTLIEIFGALKKQGKSVRLIVCNAHANAEKEKELIRRSQEYAVEKGLNATEVIYTSLENVSYALEGGPKHTNTFEQGVPREVVSQLFQLSNLFVFPSTSENCSLILLEAMLSKNLLVLNEDLPALREFGKENALYFKFGSLDTTTKYDSKEKFVEDIARIIISEFSTNRALRAQVDARKHHNFDWLFKNQIEPLLHENT